MFVYGDIVMLKLGSYWLWKTVTVSSHLHMPVRPTLLHRLASFLFYCFVKIWANSLAPPLAKNCPYADKENTAGRQLDLQPTSSSTTAIQASPASVLVQHNQVAVSNNMNENYTHGEQGLHRFSPQFNFYNCTNVQVHYNFSGSG